MKLSKTKKRIAQYITAALILATILYATFYFQKTPIPDTRNSSLSNTMITSKMSCEDSGVQMEVANISVNGSQAQITVSLRDLKGNRFDESISLFDSYRIQASCELIDDCNLIHYDTGTNTATFLVTIQQAQGENIEGENVTFNMKRILSQKEALEKEIDDIDYFPDRTSMVINTNTEETDIPYLLPDKRQAFSPVSEVTVTAYGYIEGKLHIQLFYDDLSVYEHSGDLYLRDNNRKRIDYVQRFSVRDEMKKGRYDEFIFDPPWEIPPEDLIVYGCFNTYDTLLTGNWELDFPIVHTDDNKFPATGLADISDNNAETQGMELLEHKVTRYSENESMLLEKALYQYKVLFPQYSDAQIAETKVHCRFDKQERLVYALGFLGGSSTYCEETITQWADGANSARKICYKSNRYPYKDFSYVSGRYLFHVQDYQFSEDNNILSMVQYSRYNGEATLSFDRGYWAEYDGKRLRSELKVYLSWELPYGVWDYKVYHYDAAGKRVSTVSVTGTGNPDDHIITLEQYQYDEEKDWMEYTKYKLTQDYELVCEDGSRYLFSPKSMNHTGGTVVQKTESDNTEGYKLLYDRAPQITPTMTQDMERVLLPNNINNTVEDHYYTVLQGDCLTQIALEHYGNPDFAHFIYQNNLSKINDMNIILPGQRLYLPELILSDRTEVTVER